MTAGPRQPVPLHDVGASAPDDVERCDWRGALTAPATPLRDVLPVIRALGVAAVVDSSGRLLDTLADGDIRRALLDGVGLDMPIEHLIDPSRARPRENPRAARLIVDDRQHVVGIEPAPRLQLDDRLAVIMAGGLGRRLRPLTDRCPKPLIPVGGRPLLERTVESLHRSGFRRFVFCVGYRADAIERHFGNGRIFGVHIDYVHDRDRLGTAGPLTLLEHRPAAPLLVMNGDIVTTIDVGALMAYHDEGGADATICVSEMSVQVPYGVVSIDDGSVAGITEKPSQRWRVNAGIYVLEPHVLDALPRQQAVNMPEILNTAIRRGGRVAAFPIHEQWIDIGSPTDLAHARATLAAANGDAPEPVRAGYGKQAPNRGTPSNSCSTIARSPSPHLITS